MRQQPSLADRRLDELCYSCGTTLDGNSRTVEHVPARVFLDRPYPDNLATVYSCFNCNNGTSADELYVACLLDVALVGMDDSLLVERERVRQALVKSPGLTERLTLALSSFESTWRAGESVESLTAVVMKLARGHMMYDHADPQYGPPASVCWFRLDEALFSEVESFHDWSDRSSDSPRLLPEVGSRALLRMWDSREDPGQGIWITVQEGRYSYSSCMDSGPAIRMVLRGYLACEVTW